jgi:hypothetical protein
MEAVRGDEGFEDTAFVEATEHADPYEFHGDPNSSNPDFGDSADMAARRRPPGAPAPRRPETPKGGASERLKGVKPQPPAPAPKKTSTRRVKRGPLGR